MFKKMWALFILVYLLIAIMNAGLAYANWGFGNVIATWTCLLGAVLMVQMTGFAYIKWRLS